MTDKSELLQQLKIDRNQPQVNNGIKFWQILLLLVICCILSIWITLNYIAPEPTAKQNNTLVAQANSKAQSSSSIPTESVKPIIQESDTILNSSGYITDRKSVV